MTDEIHRLIHDLKGTIRRQNLILKYICQGIEEPNTIPDHVIKDMNTALLDAKVNWELLQRKIK